MYLIFIAKDKLLKSHAMFIFVEKANLVISFTSSCSRKYMPYRFKLRIKITHERSPNKTGN